MTSTLRKSKKTVSKLAKRVKPKTVRYLRKLAWTLLSRVIRQTGCDHTGSDFCYTCNAYLHWSQLQAGHAIPGRHNAVLLDEEIIRKQCPLCNIFKRGNYQVFVAKLIRENGLDWWEEKLIESRQLKNYSREDLNEIILGYRVRLAELDVSYETPQTMVDVMDQLDAGAK